MNTHKQIQQIAATDELLDQAIAITPIRNSKDLNHLQRRQQQRAISNDMIRVAIAYGQQRSDRHGAIVYTLSDRLHLKLTGGHSKYFVCDRQFAYVGSHNILSSTIPNLKIAYPDLQGDETGTIHRNLDIIQKLITRYDQAIDLTSSNMLPTVKLTA
jgi:hypothetical protein